MVLRAAFLGPGGTYAEEATLALLGQEISRVPHPSIQGTLRSVLRGEADCAVVPVENAIEGTVSATLDTLWLLDLPVHSALVLPVRHCLIGHATELRAIQAVYSHPQALGQCQGWLEEHLGHAPRVPTASTAEALTRLDSPAVAAIASERAAQMHGLPVLQYAIQDHPDNCTRFWLVGEVPLLAEKARATPTMTSIAFALRQNQPGVLHEALSVFASYRINLAKLESRPTRKVLGEYLFFADLEGNALEPPIAPALSELSKLVFEWKLLGSYPVLHASDRP